MAKENISLNFEWEKSFPENMPFWEKGTRHLLRIARSYLYALYAYIRFYKRKDQHAHTIKGELILSLTSYPPRFSTLHRTLWCLLDQTIQPDRTILWIAESDANLLPSSVKKLEAKGLEIHFCKDTGPYKKIVPALSTFPEAHIVTADDDLYYPSNWLEQLLKSWNGQKNQIVCHRAMRCELSNNKEPLPYTSWKDETRTTTAADILPTNGAGTLFPPGSLSHDTVNEKLFLKLCARADDIWLFWMARRAGSIFKKTPTNFKLISWMETEKHGLRYENCEESANDKKIKTMIAHFGWPS